jgi:hypothetical protein
MVAAVRPDAWDLPLIVHVAGAMLLVGALVVVLVLAGAAMRRREGAAVLTRLAFRGLVLGVLPGYVVMRVGAEWVASEEGVGDPAWIGIGYSTADGGLLLAVVATVLAWRASRRGDAGPGGLGRAVVGLSAFLLVAYVVAIWAMTTKPS